MKNVIFDFDGTLADSLQTAILVYNQIAAEQGFKQVTLENKEALRGMTPQRIMSELGIRIYDVPTIALRVRKELRCAVSKWKLHDGIREMISELKNKGYFLYILSSNSEENVREFLRIHQLELFDGVMSATSIFGKAGSLKEIMKARKLDPHQTIYVGDEIRDIESAKKAGLGVISVAWGLNTAEALAKSNPTVLVNKPNEILEFLNRLT